jgi:hypothetical protein
MARLDRFSSNSAPGLATAYRSPAHTPALAAVQLVGADVVEGARNAARDELMRQLIEDHISEASTQQTAPIIVEANGEQGAQGGRMSGSLLPQLAISGVGQSGWKSLRELLGPTQGYMDVKYPGAAQFWTRYREIAGKPATFSQASAYASVQVTKGFTVCRLPSHAPVNLIGLGHILRRQTNA